MLAGAFALEDNVDPARAAAGALLFEPLLEFLGYTVGRIFRDERSGRRIKAFEPTGIVLDEYREHSARTAQR